MAHGIVLLHWIPRLVYTYRHGLCATHRVQTERTGISWASEWLKAHSIVLMYSLCIVVISTVGM